MNAHAKLSVELAKWDWLRPHLQAEDFDAVALMTALESETNIPECLLELGEAALEADALAAAARARAKQITERASRHEIKSEKLRRVILNAMIQANITEPIRGDNLTLSKRPRGRELIVTDVAKIPKEYFDDADPKLNKRRLRDAMADQGKVVEGAQLDNGGFSVAILTR